VLNAILRNRAAVVGVPAVLFGCALIVGVASALNGFNHPAPFVVLCFVAAVSLMLAGFISVIGYAKVSVSRRIELVLGAGYIGIGLVTLLVGLVFFGLMNACLVCM
jgi:hypothetical protein